MLLDWLGRRRTLMLVNAPAVVGWILIATTPHSEPWLLYQVYAGRLLTGIAAGLVSTPAVVYVGETMDKIWRGVLITWPSIGKRPALAVSTLMPSVSDLPHHARNTVMETRVRHSYSKRLAVVRSTGCTVPPRTITK